MSVSVTVNTACIHGLKVIPLTLDVTVAPGVPGVTIVGLPDASVLESRERVRCAIRSAGYEMPPQHVTVAITPSTLRVTGTQLDLAIAYGILHATHQVPSPQQDAFFIGELALDGRVTPTRGLAAYDDYCRSHAMTLVCPESPEPYSYLSLCHLNELRSLDWGNLSTNPRVAPDDSYPHEFTGFLRDVMGAYLDTNKVLLLRGQDRNVGPAVRTLRQALPRLDQRQCDELRSIYSVCHEPFTGEPPFRCPHHSITPAGLVGGGRPVFPGEITLASHGLLLLSDIENWTPTTLATLRTSLRTRESRIARAEGTWHMPATPALVVATSTDTRPYRNRILGPLADLADEVHIAVWRGRNA